MLISPIWETLIEMIDQDQEEILAEEISENEVLATVVREKCIRPFVPNVERVVKFLFNQPTEDLFIAVNVLRRKMEDHKLQEDLKIEVRTEDKTEVQEDLALIEEMREDLKEVNKDHKTMNK
jgi:hypothetical protein